ncbi:ribonuclease P protein component [filamentous cyanobacterium CCP5]|nr:ribonuclease P protein component [filamentous cyanobacterium CCP5]
MALPQQHRLKHTQEFAAVYRRGRKAAGKLLVMRILPRSKDLSDGASSRFGIAISQKVSKRAVVRNRLKRQIHTALRHLVHDIQPGLNVVINVRPSAVICEYDEILRELEQLFVQLEVTHGH